MNLIIEQLDILWLKLSNPFRKHPHGIIRKVGLLEVHESGITISGWDIDGLGKFPAFDLSGPTLKIVGYETGIELKDRMILPPL